MAKKQFSRKSAKAATVSTRLSADEVLALGRQADEATRAWIYQNAPAHVHAAISFADAVRELATTGDESPTTRDALERSALELLPTAQDALAKLAKTNGQAPEIRFPRYFLLMMIDAGHEALFEWLRTHGPKAIFDLLTGIDTLRCALEDPTDTTPENYAEAIMHIATGKQLAGLSEWPDYLTVQPDASAAEVDHARA